MSEIGGMTRREFNVLSALALLGGATISVTGCGGAQSMTSATATGDGSVDGTISANHPAGHAHAATITGAQLTDGGDLSLNIQFQADHNHVVSLTAAEVVAIHGGSTVAKQSTETEAHSHLVTFAKGGNDNSGPGY
jgi:hypothetical protein